jgi:flagellar P-ring protein FlgI
MKLNLQTNLRGFLAALVMLLAGLGNTYAQGVPIKGLGRFDGWRENALIGYGLVVGLAGSGDSERSVVTRQALTNVYGRMGATVSGADISSRNAAIVMVIAKLPASANVGDRISATVSSTGDARSLAGGTLLMTTLNGPDGRTYALAQGPLVAGGDSFTSQLNLRQRNYPTTARLEDGATVEAPVEAQLLGPENEITFLLQEPSFTTASRIADAINAHFGDDLAWAKGADEVGIRVNAGPRNFAEFVSAVENLPVVADRSPRVVINERTGTVVAGGDVTISSVVISQGDVRVTVDSESYASQPAFIEETPDSVRSLIVTNTRLEVDRGRDDVVATFGNSTVADLVSGLSKAKVDTRRMITILQAMRAAGALHAEIVVQ